MNRVEIKKRAKEFAFNNKWAIWKPCLIIYAISFIAGVLFGFSGISDTSILGTILTYALEFLLLPANIGYVGYVIKLIKGENLDVKEALLSKYKLFVLIFVVNIMVSLFTVLWSLLLIIPGIIYTLEMAMVNYILAEAEDEKSYKDIMNLSKEMMNGYKWDFVKFNLSFIPWVLLTVVTFGIAIIWVYPYITVSEVMYYEELKKLKNIN